MEAFVTGTTIKKLREEKRITQGELAQMIGVSDKAVSKWETGRGLPDISLLEPLSRALGISVAEQMCIRDRSVSSGLIYVFAAAITIKTLRKYKILKPFCCCHLKSPRKYLSDVL